MKLLTVLAAVAGIAVGGVNAHDKTKHSGSARPSTSPTPSTSRSPPLSPVAASASEVRYHRAVIVVAAGMVLEVEVRVHNTMCSWLTNDVQCVALTNVHL